MHDVPPPLPRPGMWIEPASINEGLDVAVKRVVPTVSVTALGDGHGQPGEPGAPSVAVAPEDGDVPELEVPWASLRHIPRPVAVLAVAGGLGIGPWLASGDVRIGITCVLAVGLFAWLRSVDPPFSFGEGFVGYRPDPAWPRGVQEDDDVRWDWRPRT